MGYGNCSVLAGMGATFIGPRDSGRKAKKARYHKSQEKNGFLQFIIEKVFFLFPGSKLHRHPHPVRMIGVLHQQGFGLRVPLRLQVDSPAGGILPFHLFRFFRQ